MITLVKGAMTIRKGLHVIVGTAFFIGGFYLLIESQWIYAALCFLIGFWYFIQSIKVSNVGKKSKDYRTDDDYVDNNDNSSDGFLDYGDSGGGDD
jgi:hypothetical protein